MARAAKRKKVTVSSLLMMVYDSKKTNVYLALRKMAFYIAVPHKKTHSKNQIFIALYLSLEAFEQDLP